MEDFLARIRKTDGCWIWAGAVATNGYGTIGSRPHRYAHRVAYEHFVGPLPAGTEVDHLCRNPLCVNPAHLEAVTHRENVLRGTSPAALNAGKAVCPSGHDDWYLRPDGKGRYCRTCRALRAGYVPGGPGHAKLTLEQAAALRERYAAGGVSQAALAAHYGIDRSQVSRIITGRRRSRGDG